MKLKRQKTGVSPGLTLIEVLVVVVCLVLLAAVLLPAIAKAKSKAQRAYCQNDLMQIGLAFRIWEGDHDEKYPMRVSTSKGGTMEWAAGSDMFRHFQVMEKQLYNPIILVCPSDNREPATSFTNFSNSNLSYFLGLDADEAKPNMILSGDRNMITNGAPVGAGLLTITTSNKTGWNTNMHNRAGNLGLADGSVQQTASSSLQQFFQRTGTNVNRLAVP